MPKFTFEQNAGLLVVEASPATADHGRQVTERPIALPPAGRGDTSVADNDNSKLALYPLCKSCGRQTNGPGSSFLNPKTGRIVRIFKCQCGQLVWEGDQEGRPGAGV